MHKIVNEVIGWCGALLILGAYALSSFEILPASSLVYQLMNVFGAMGVAYISFAKNAYQPGVLNIVWAAVACIAIARMFL